MLHKKRKPSTFTLSSSKQEGHITTSKTKLHSKSTYFYRWNSLIPACCGIALLLGVGIILNPAINDNKAHAETITTSPTDYSSISLTISNNGTELNTGDTVSTDVQPGFVNYISNNLKIDTKKINRFYVSVQAAEDGTSELTGTDKHATIAPVGSNKIPTATDENGFGDNTWGFALGETSVANDSMVYNSLPAYGTSTTPDYSSASNLADGSYNLKLTFAAKINADKPNDHYTTKTMVSVAADAKSITMLDIAKMQDMTADICRNTASGASKQLTDDRTASGLGQTKYWVAKLKDGKCWMTQNLDLEIGAGKTLSPEDSDTNSLYTFPDSIRYINPGALAYKSASANAALPTSSCGDLTSTTCKNYFGTLSGNLDGNVSAHYLVGDYYDWYVAALSRSGGSICPRRWKLPLSYDYELLSEGLTQDTIRRAPYYFIPAGRNDYGSNYAWVNAAGYYWTATGDDQGNYYNLRFSSSGGILVTKSAGEYLFSVRCVASGA